MCAFGMPTAMRKAHEGPAAYAGADSYKPGGSHQRAERTARAVDRMNLTG